MVHSSVSTERWIKSWIRNGFSGTITETAQIRRTKARNSPSRNSFRTERHPAWRPAHLRWRLSSPPESRSLHERALPSGGSRRASRHCLSYSPRHTGEFFKALVSNVLLTILRPWAYASSSGLLVSSLTYSTQHGTTISSTGSSISSTMSCRFRSS